MFRALEKRMKRILFQLLLLITSGKFNGTQVYAQTDFDLAAKQWENGNIPSAQELLERLLMDHPDHDKAKRLLMKVFYVQGKYEKSIELFTAISPTLPNNIELLHLAVNALLRLKKHEAALQLAESNKLFPHELILQWRRKPFDIKADRTYIIPFTDQVFEMANYKISSDFWPGVKGSINGMPCDLRLDTGGDYLVMGKEAAQKLNLKLIHKTKELHNITMVNSWSAIADQMTFNSDLEFTNVPVTVLETLGNAIIIGTNILEQFLTTIDYPNGRFILTPRNNTEQKRSHYAMLRGDKVQIPFYLWSDHYMIAKGSFSKHDNLNLFFDSGLLYITKENGKDFQASLFAAKETLLKWRFKKKELAQSSFLFTEYPLEVAGLRQPNTLIWYDKNLKKDRNFGGIRIDGLISHAWLKNYAWTIDFENMEYTFTKADK